ncbi:ESX-1 secretion-associated protein [Mycolicibacterium vanbaalenii]|jgi:hypothetical protein|uniref:ESX-1 secretion-associated protein n=1 Tax=Mycolicibacterium vanbaalenii TaxID=110539 RepID=UPI001F404615|nr:ESX-1 secretion-associated protein [Mycolicibacterium vanbaalenii]UJL28643.1 ESX-1 secretion-associated protein [Mycolicibacterium vanbaalenii]WND55346.1 ESX-1 secretion-associated protein [Mycolicibacterium vanbaalenii]
MTEPLSVDADGVRSLGEIHNRVAAGLGSLAAASPGPAAVAGSHGTIAAAVDTALTGALGSRSGTLAGTRTAGDTISELLHQAALAYERGDHRGAEAIRTAADQMAHGPTQAGAAGAAPPAGGTPTGGGADALGQAAGQLGQLAQMGQQLGAPLAALAQLPQLLTQGFAQLAQSSSAETGSGEAEIPDVGDRTPGREPDEEPTADDDQPAAEDKEPEAPSDAGAAPGTPPGPGPAPVPQAPPRPAPTRPAVG